MLLRPFDKTEIKLIFITSLALFLDATSTAWLHLERSKSLDYIESNPVVGMMYRNIFFGIFLYSYSWLFVILFFRIVQSVEFSLSLLHITSSGIAVLDNLGIILFRNPFFSNLFESYNLRMEHILFIVFLTYIFLYIKSISKIKDVSNVIKQTFITLFGMLFAIILEFIIIYIWIRHLYIFFW
jgi:hypothetical protein